MLLSYLSLLALAAAGMTHALAADRPLAVDPAQSRVEIAVKATVDSFTGKLTRYEPAIMVGDDGRVSSARVAFHFRDVVTGKDSRDKAMHKWQQTDTFPDGAFVLSSLDAAAGPGYTASGRLTFHGITRDIRFPVSVTRDGAVYGIDGDATIDTREYGLPIIRMIGVLKVDPIVHVRFHLQGSTNTLTASNRAAR
ncbi:MAG: YceI family protein [Opitutaceae bacterium]|nr:YceI family protein [Opitutaceae bacterium]